MKKVLSIRMSPQTLADVYNFLSIACDYNVNNLPISTAVQISLENMMTWVRQSIDLPVYESEEDALKAIESFIKRRPASYVEKTTQPTIIQRPIREETVHATNHLIEQNLGDNSNAVAEKEEKEKSKDKLVSLIDTFLEKNAEKSADDLLSAIKIDDIIKEDADE